MAAIILASPIFLIVCCVLDDTVDARFWDTSSAPNSGVDVGPLLIDRAISSTSWTAPFATAKMSSPASMAESARMLA